MSIFRFTTIPYGSLLLISFFGCSHIQEINRTPAEAMAAKGEFEVRINPRNEFGAYIVHATAHIPKTQGASFSEIVSIFRDPTFSRPVVAELRSHKAPPLNKIVTEMELKRGSHPGEVDYFINAYPENLKMVASNKSKLACTETFSKSTWEQVCKADFKYEETDKYISDYVQNYKCLDMSTELTCTLHTEGVMKKIDVPWLAEALFGAKDFSATQAAYKSSENIMHLFYSLLKLTNFQKPFTSHGVEAVNTYIASPLYKEVLKIDKKFPKDIEFQGGAFIQSSLQ